MERHDMQVLLVAFYAQSSEPVGKAEASVRTLGAEGFWDPRGIVNLWRIIRAHRPDVIHVHHTWSAFWGSLLGTLIGVPVVKTVHNDNRYGRPYQKLLNAVTFALSDWVVCNSLTTYRSMLAWERFVTGSQYSIIHNGVDVQRISAGRRSADEARQVLGLSADAMVVGSVGRMVEQKNFSRLIEAFALLSRTSPKLQLVLVGGGQLLEFHRDQAKQYGIADRVLFTGPLLRDDVYGLLDAFDVFVMPSSWEGFCNAVVEAMVAERVIVCSDIRTLREVVGEHALYADPTSAKHIAEALAARVGMSPAQRLAEGKSAAEFARQHYAVGRAADAYTRVYRRLRSDFERNPSTPAQP